MKHGNGIRNFLLLFSLAALGLAVMGYHPGLEDDAVYLAAVKAALHPTLFPFHPEFFRLQMEATFFDGWMAWFVRASGISVDWAELIWQFLSLFVVLWACLRIAQRLFTERHVQWASVAAVSAMFTLPVSGTALFLMDQHLHPRNLATALILMAVAEVMAFRKWVAAPLLAGAFLMHPIMATLGISFCVFLSLAMLEAVPRWVPDWVTYRVVARRGSTAALVPLGWVFESANPMWKKALDTKTYYSLLKWHWYEWLGALAPLAIFGLIWRMARRRADHALARFAAAVFAYGVFQQFVALAMLGPSRWIRLTPLQPMRYLQLVYFFMVLLLGGLIGRHVLERKIWRWAIFMLAFNGGMLAAQRAEFSASQHLELPGRISSNDWLQAFAWIRVNTPVDAYFALDPYYLQAAGEDYHGFRALAERSQLADAVKDAAAVTQVPELGPEWDREVSATQGWEHFEAKDFERLKHDFGVNWVVIGLSQIPDLDCRWHNATLAVCRIP